MTSAAGSGSSVASGVSPNDARQRAARLDAADPLATRVDLFVEGEGVEAYFDGNSLGRPLRETSDRVASFIADEWGSRLIRSWDERWMDLPFDLGDRIGRVLLGAAAGQTVVADSTTVMLYKLMHAALAANPGRSEIVIEAGNFPTNRFVAAGVAASAGGRVTELNVDPLTGVTIDDAAAALTDDTALLVLSHVDYRSAAIADMRAITELAHQRGAVVLWDLCHAVGAVPVALDDCDVDFAAGCTYKYLNGGPGAPAFAYVASRLQGSARQPIQGWMGAADVFAMGGAYVPSDGMRQYISGTPPVFGMLPLPGMLELLESVGIEAVRAKSIALTEFAVELFDAWLAPAGAELVTTRDAALRGGHISVRHPSFASVYQRLWNEGVMPDYRNPDILRLGFSPLSTSFSEVDRGMAAIRDAMSV